MEESKIKVYTLNLTLWRELRIKNYEVLENLLYTKEHEWAKIVDRKVRVGITDYAAKALGDVVYVSLPAIGTTVKQFVTFGTVESIKAVSELYSPLSGTVERVNEQLNSQPELINKSPYDEGWIIELHPTNFEVEAKKLLNSKEYSEYLEALLKK